MQALVTGLTWVAAPLAGAAALMFLTALIDLSYEPSVLPLAVMSGAVVLLWASLTYMVGRVLPQRGAKLHWIGCALLAVLGLLFVDLTGLAAGLRPAPTTVERVF